MIQVKELGVRIDDLEEEAEAERQGRARAEKQKAELAKELGELTERLEEAGGATSAQIELNKRREGEMGRLRRDLEECHIIQESQLTGMKQKHGEAMAELTDQLDVQMKLKQK